MKIGRGSEVVAGMILGIAMIGTLGLLQAYFMPAARAQISVPGNPMTSLGYCQMTVNASTGLAACSGGIPSGANAIIVRAEAQALRYRLDGATTPPTASIGMPVLVADPPLFMQLNGSAAMAAVRFIAQTTGGIVNVTFYRAP